MFVATEGTAVTLDGQNIIFIRPKMDFGTKALVEDALLEAEAGSKKSKLRWGAYQTALLVHNVLKWSGPAFVGVDCNEVNVRRLDPDEPLVSRVLDEIAKRNLPGADAAEKKGGMTAGGPP
jgi:hypothetical protein